MARRRVAHLFASTSNLIKRPAAISLPVSNICSSLLDKTASSQASKWRMVRLNLRGSRPNHNWKLKGCKYPTQRACQVRAKSWSATQVTSTSSTSRMTSGSWVNVKCTNQIKWRWFSSISAWLMPCSKCKTITCKGVLRLWIFQREKPWEATGMSSSPGISKWWSNSALPKNKPYIRTEIHKETPIRVINWSLSVTRQTTRKNLAYSWLDHNGTLFWESSKVWARLRVCKREKTFLVCPRLASPDPLYLLQMLQPES